MHVSLQIMIATLSVLGLYFLLKTLASLIFSNKQLAAAVIIESEAQLENLDILIAEASGALFCARRRRIAVLVPKSVWDSCEKNKKAETVDLCCDCGVTIYTV